MLGNGESYRLGLSKKKTVYEEVKSKETKLEESKHVFAPLFVFKKD